MTPPAVAEQVEKAVDVLQLIRAHLSQKERALFDMELLETRHVGRDQLRHTLYSWAFTVLMRSHPAYAEQHGAVMKALRSGDPFGTQAVASA